MGEVYACPFMLAPEFSGGNVRQVGGRGVWRNSPLFAHLRDWQVGGTCQTCNAYDLCHGGCGREAFHRTFPGFPDPDCVFQNAEHAPVQTCS